MKKTYINPEMEIIKIETHSILASSADIDPTPVNAGDAEAPGMLNDDEIFQLFLIH